MVFKKLSFYGDSLMIPRPGVVGGGENHPRVLESWLRVRFPHTGWEVLQRACGSHTITEIRDWTASDNSYYADVSGGIAVVQSGIVDAAPRPVNQRVRRFISSLPMTLRKPVIHFLHHQRARILRGGLGSVITPLPRFENAARTILGRLCTTHEHVFVITICPTNPSTEEHSPGISHNIIAYNEAWQRVLKEHPGKAHLIDVHAFMTAQPDIDRWLVKEDGHHITPETHRWIAEEIIRVLDQSWRPDVSPQQ